MKNAKTKVIFGYDGNWHIPKSPVCFSLIDYINIVLCHVY